MPVLIHSLVIVKTRRAPFMPNSQLMGIGRRTCFANLRLLLMVADAGVARRDRCGDVNLAYRTAAYSAQ